MSFNLPFIGLRGSCDNESNSGLYINDLPGITLKSLAHLANEEQIRGENLFREKEKNAITKVKRDFLNLIQKDYTFQPILSTEIVMGNYGEFVDADCIGVKIENCKRETIEIDLQHLSIMIDKDINTKLIIKEDNKVTEINKVIPKNIDYRFAERLTTNAGTILIYLNLGTAKVSKIVNCGCDCTPYCSDCVTMTPISVVGSTVTTLDYWPVSIKVVCRNTYEPLYCLYDKELAQAVLYQTGIEIMTELYVTDQINPIITNTKNDADKLLSLWAGIKSEKMYPEDGEYYKSLFSVVLMAVNYLKQAKLNTRPNVPYFVSEI